jgi:hypothetical protein
LDNIFKYNSFSEYIEEEIGEPYSARIKELIGRIPVGTNIPFFSEERIEDGMDMLNQGFKYMKKVQTHVNYNRELSDHLHNYVESVILKS